MRRLPHSRTKQKYDLSLSDSAWMYAGLFFALMIVGLATISFEPNYGTIKNINNSYGYYNVFKEQLNVAYDHFDPIQIEKDVAWFATSRGLPNTMVPVYVRILGGYSATNEKPLIAIDRANRFANLIRQSGITNLDNAAFNFGSSAKLEPGKVMLKITFADPVTVTSQR